MVVGARGIPNVEGGAEKNAEELFPRLASLGCDVTLVGLASKMKNSNFRGVKLIGTPEVRFLKTEKLICYLSSIFYSLKLKPDIVHMQGLGAAILLPIFKLFGFKTVARYGSADYLVDKWGFVGRNLFRLCERNLKMADAVISVTPALSLRLEERGVVGNVHYVPNALDDVPSGGAAAADDIDPGTPFFISVGRVTNQKNITTLVKAFNLYAERHPDHRLLVVGGLDDVTYVEALKPLLTENVRLVGRLDRSVILELLRRCTAYVNPSHHEGRSNATMEAISMGAPIAVSDIPENRDLDLPPDVFFDKDDPRAIADCLEAALRNPDEFRADKTSFLTWDDVARQTAAVYERINA